MSVTALTPIEQIAETVAGWGDGWEWLCDPSGRRATLRRAVKDIAFVRIVVRMDGNYPFVEIETEGVSRRDQRIVPIPSSLRDPLTRKALDYINAQLDTLEADTHGETDND